MLLLVGLWNMWVVYGGVHYCLPCPSNGRAWHSDARVHRCSLHPVTKLIGRYYRVAVILIMMSVLLELGVQAAFRVHLLHRVTSRSLVPIDCVLYLLHLYELLVALKGVDIGRIAHAMAVINGHFLQAVVLLRVAHVLQVTVCLLGLDHVA